MPEQTRPLPPAVAVAQLRARLQAMGGLADPSGLSRRPPPARPSIPPVSQRAASLGFAEDACSSSSVLVRRARVDLAALLDGAGVTAPATPNELIRLLYRLPDDIALRDLPEREVVVLDIETLGLRGSGVVPFLVGVAGFDGSVLEIQQYLLADPDKEPEMLDALIDRLTGRRLMITYNGRSFDIPILQSRCVINRRPPERLAPAFHCDLLAPVRRLFRERLRACTLRQTELVLLAMDRGDDVPGCEAPARYRAWLAGASPSIMEGVIRHNQMDLCATAVLAARLVRHVAGDLIRPVHPADRYRLGVHLEFLGLADAAEEHLWSAFHDAGAPWARPAGHRIARRWRRAASPGPLPIWSELHRRHPSDIGAARGLAIALERSGDLAGALAVCGGVEAELAARNGWQRRLAVAGTGCDRLEVEWRHRRGRLQRRLGRHPLLPGIASA